MKPMMYRTVCIIGLLYVGWWFRGQHDLVVKPAGAVSSAIVADSISASPPRKTNIKLIPTAETPESLASEILDLEVKVSALK